MQDYVPLLTFQKQDSFFLFCLPWKWNQWLKPRRVSRVPFPLPGCPHSQLGQPPTGRQWTPATPSSLSEGILLWALGDMPKSGPSSWSWQAQVISSTVDIGREPIRERVKNLNRQRTWQSRVKSAPCGTLITSASQSSSRGARSLSGGTTPVSLLPRSFFQVFIARPPCLHTSEYWLGIFGTSITMITKLGTTFLVNSRDFIISGRQYKFKYL